MTLHRGDLLAASAIVRALADRLGLAHLRDLAARLAAAEPTREDDA